jgi:hypothetical protein
LRIGLASIRHPVTREEASIGIFIEDLSQRSDHDYYKTPKSRSLAGCRPLAMTSFERRTTLNN